MTSNYILRFDEHDKPYLAHADQKVWKQHKYLMKVPDALGPGKDLYLYTQKEIDAWNKHKKRTLSNRIRDRLGFDERDRLTDLQNDSNSKRFLNRREQQELQEAKSAYENTSLARFEHARESIQKFKDTKLSEVRNALGDIKSSIEENKEERERKKLQKQVEKQVNDIAQSLEKESERSTSAFSHVSVTEVYQKRKKQKEDMLRNASTEDSQRELRRDLELLELAYAQSMSKYKTPEVKDMVSYLSSHTIDNNRGSISKSYNQLKNSLTTQKRNARDKSQIERYDNQLRALEMAYKAMTEIYNTDESAVTKNALEAYMSFYYQK